MKPPDRDPPRARSLVLQFGWNVVSYQILNPGISHWFSKHGDAVVGYVARTGYWVVAGAPICRAERLGDVILEFEASAREAKRKVCYFGAGERLYENCSVPPKHSVVAIGAQPVWIPGDWDAMVRRRASVRAQILRARNKSVSVTEWKEGPAEFKQQLHECLADWLATRKMPTMHFLVEPDTLEVLDDRRLFVATRNSLSDAAGASDRIVGFLVASPVPARNGWLVEQIIRARGAPNGTNEALLDVAIRALAEGGSQYVTLGLVPLARKAIPEAVRRNPFWLRLLFGWVRAHGRRFYDFDGLEAFKSKFEPSGWEPIFVICNEPRFGFRSLYAISAAFSDKASPVRQVSGALLWAVRQETRKLWRRLPKLQSILGQRH